MKQLHAGRFWRSMGFLASVHAVALLFFFAFRLALFLTSSYKLPEEVATDYALQAEAFVRGLWFDNVIACYILILPLAAFWVAGWFNFASRWLYRSAAVFFSVFYGLSFVFCAANLPYFEYFFKPINSSIFAWSEYVGTTAAMVFGEPSYYFAIALGVVAIAAFSLIATRLSRSFSARSLATPGKWHWAGFISTFVAGAMLVGLCMFGIRGRRGYNPIKVSQAYYCNDPFLNQLGVNAVFNLITSAIDDGRKENRTLCLMAGDEAVAATQRLLGRTGIDGISPIARRVEPATGTKAARRNVVIILMESMSAHLMAHFGHEGNLTPFLDSLYDCSLSFSRFYSSGIHTNHGLYASLYSFPAMMKRNAMKGTVIPAYSGLPTVLKENGYHNSFFMTHESQYDNMNAFFRTNGFDEIYSQENYPKEKVVNGFGVQDDFLFQYALPVLDKQAETGMPFFSVLLTISNHPPYIVPPHFTPRSDTKEEQIVEYADWCVGNFMEEALRRPWADNTIFVLLGDHGKLVGTPECECPQSYNHIPLMIHGKGIEPRVVDSFGGQVDLAPTLLGLLGIGYVQNDFGVDLLREHRPCMFYTADDVVAARDSSRLFLHYPASGQSLCYHTHATGLQKADPDSAFEAMKHYAFSMLQCAETMVASGQTLNHAKHEQ